MTADFIVISGGPCSGKTTVIDALAERGHATIPEAATELIRDPAFDQLRTAPREFQLQVLLRQLENEIERCVALSGDADVLGVEMLSDSLRRGAAVPAVALRDAPMNDAVDALKRAMIEDALRETGNTPGAARKLGMPRQSLQKMMKRLEME